MERSPESARGSFCHSETSSVYEAFSVIRHHVWYWWDIFSASYDKKEAVLNDLEAFINKAEPNRKYSKPSIKKTQRNVMF